MKIPIIEAFLFFYTSLEQSWLFPLKCIQELKYFPLNHSESTTGKKSNKESRISQEIVLPTDFAYKKFFLKHKPGYIIINFTINHRRRSS